MVHPLLMMQAMREESVTPAVLRRSISPYKTSGSLLTFVTPEEEPTRRRAAYIVLGGVCTCVVGSLSRNECCVSWFRRPVDELVRKHEHSADATNFQRSRAEKATSIRTFAEGFLDLHSLYGALRDVTTSKRRTT